MTNAIQEYGGAVTCHRWVTVREGHDRALAEPCVLPVRVLRTKKKIHVTCQSAIYRRAGRTGLIRLWRFTSPLVTEALAGLDPFLSPLLVKRTAKSKRNAVPFTVSGTGAGIATTATATIAATCATGAATRADATATGTAPTRAVTATAGTGAWAV